MKIILTLACFLMSVINPIFNFGSQNNTPKWRVVNDGVMGGLSNSSVIEKENSIVFSGYTSLDNNGGFASIRSTFPLGDLKDCTTMSIRFKSPNTKRSFGISLKDSQKYYIPYYKYLFQPKTNKWEELTVDLKDFGYYNISKKIGNNMPLEFLNNVYNIALIISDGKEGDFTIEIDYITFK